MKINSAFLLLATLFLSCSAFANTQASDLRQQILGHIESITADLTAKDYRTEISIGRIDPRLAIGNCSENLIFELVKPIYKQNQNTVKATCNDPIKPWKIYISVTVDLFGPVVVANTPILKGSLISASMLTTKEGQINKARQPTFTSVDKAINMTAKKFVKEGQALTPALLQAPRLVNRGDQVTIIAQNENIYIKMNGTALSNGKKGQQISIRNDNSNRIVKATVLSHGKVSVPL